LPLFEYRCTSCGHRFEKIEKFNAEPEVACPRCGGQLERPLTAPALQFKGAGWYVNDYASKSSSSSSSDKPASDSPSSSDSKPAESKPAAQTKTSSESAAKPASSTGTS
jgi:putative FmdB family regulatory protein